MSCLCAPTTHAGSFRCRLHRPQQSWGGRPMPCRPANEECLQAIEADTVSESSVPIAIPVDQSFQPMVPVATSLPSSPRSPSRGVSRLQRMTCSDELMGLVANTTDEKLHTVKMATGSGGTGYAYASGGRPSMYRMLKTGNSGSKIYL